MIVVSQDKYNVLNFDTTVNIGIEELSTLSDEVAISAQTNGNTIVLGKYENEKRAKEVLQELIKRYSDYEKSKYIDNKNMKKYIPDEEGYTFIGERFDNYAVFIMPDE